MTYGYWFWLGVFSLLGAIVLLIVSERKHTRTVRTVHAVVLFSLLAFGGFKCAREEYVRSELFDTAPVIYTVAKTRSDGGGMKMHEDGRRVTDVEYRYTFNGRQYAGLGHLSDVYTVERDFFPEDLQNRCLLIRMPNTHPEMSMLAAVLRSCPKVPAQGWREIPDNVRASVDGLWHRGLP